MALRTLSGACQQRRSGQKQDNSFTDRLASTAWMDNINTRTGLSMEESNRMTEDRDKWRVDIETAKDQIYSFTGQLVFAAIL